jgi:hypothetical protein
MNGSPEGPAGFEDMAITSTRPTEGRLSNQ